MTKEGELARRAREYVRQEFDLIPLRSAHLIWNHTRNEKGEWLNEAFVIVPTDFDKVKLDDLSSSTGADTAGWPNSEGNNPFLHFGQIITMKWLNDCERISAICEFAKIDEADWARQIVKGMAWNAGVFTDDPDGPSFSDSIATIEQVDRIRDLILERHGNIHS